MTTADAIRDAHQMLRSGQGAAAARRLEALASAHPADAELAHHLGLVLLAVEGPAAALPHLERSLALAPGRADFRSNYGAALNRAGRHAEAAEEYRRALARSPGDFSALLGLSGALGAVRDFDGAIDAARRAAGANPARPEPAVNLAMALTRAGRVPEALGEVERALARFPESIPLLTHLAAGLHYLPDADGPRIRAAHERLGAALSRGVPPPGPFANPRDPERTLRVGYLSPDFREHSVAHFLRPVLASHDPSRVAVVCYSCVARPDAVTEELRALAPAWREVALLPDAALADLIRADGIDILVDLAGHMAASRVAIMARRPAPVQATWLGYPGTTGLPAADYRIVDSITDPPGAEAHATETLVRLPGCFLCYGPPAAAPEPLPETSPAARPEEAPRPLTFGSFNTAQKISGPVIDAWAAILKAVPGSRLLLRTLAFDGENVRRDLAARFTVAGVDPARLALEGWADSAAAHLGAYRRVDVALDTFPYNGTTTTCEALWMGVPVVTLEGRLHAGRVGASILEAVGLPELIARSPGQYTAAAAALAADTPRRAALRAGLRERVRGSPLCDAPAFTRKLEDAYREMWRRHCRAR